VRDVVDAQPPVFVLAQRGGDREKPAGVERVVAVQLGLAVAFGVKLVVGGGVHRVGVARLPEVGMTNL
jgi:hypothetical protein